MKLLSKISATLILLLAFSICNAQIKNAKTESVKIYGNCAMCETTIEKAGNLKKIAQVDWNKDTKMAKLTYDPKKTNQAEILKRIALAGYDSDQFLAPDDAYAKLPECCQYKRVNKTAPLKKEVEEKHAMEKHQTTSEKKQEVNQLKAVFDNYFEVKDALVKTDGGTAATKAKELLIALNAVKMETLKSEEHTVWMKVMKSLADDAEEIANAKNIGNQRENFSTLSKNMYELIKVSKTEKDIYYQNCPMYNDGKGANWLSKDNAIKNPYYGSQMMTCGKTIETIK